MNQTVHLVSIDGQLFGTVSWPPLMPHPVAGDSYHHEPSGNKYEVVRREFREASYGSVSYDLIVK